MNRQVRNTRKNHRDKTDRRLAVLALLTLVIAYIVGIYLQEDNLQVVIDRAIPGSDRIEETEPGIFTAYRGNQKAGYITVGESNGYGGPLKAVVTTDTDGKITSVEVVVHKETPSFFNRILRSLYVQQFIGKSFSSSLQVGTDIDSITGATDTSNAICDAVRSGSWSIAENELGIVPAEAKPVSIRFGYPEILLILLYIAGFVGRRRRFRYKKQLRWLMLLTGMCVLGFWYNIPLTLSRINSFLLGYWPDWQTHVYWYLLVGGILLIFTKDDQNAYCAWFCPFGAAQDCMGVIGGARWNVPRQYRRYLLWAQRGLAWFAIALAFLFRNPGIASYEVFGTLFSFTGTVILFVLLAIILLVSLFVKRPWCSFLCPLDSVYSFIRLIRTWILERWRGKQTVLVR